MLKDIYKRLNLETDLKKEQEKFIKRIQLIFKNIESKHLSPAGGPNNYLYSVSNGMAFLLGEEKRECLEEYLDNPTIERVLTVSEIFLNVIENAPGFYSEKKDFPRKIEEAINLSIIDLSFYFKNGKFYKKGAIELDEKLILETLDWLNDYPKTKLFFEGALKENLHKDYPDAITKSYSALESTVMTILNNNTNLKKNIPKLLEKLNLPDQWGKILFNFCAYAHEFSSRHGKGEKTKKAIVTPEIVEAYIYFTGLVIRLVILRQKSIST
jgi:hypothetical protein